jgi:hypothetical protein
MDALIYSRSFAYCKGFVDGYNIGIQSNPFDGEHQARHHQLYKIGYDAGVAEYCAIEIDNEEVPIYDINE